MFKKVFSFLLGVFYMAVPYITLAQDFGLKETGKKAFGSSSPIIRDDRNIQVIIGNLINILLGFLGIIFLLLIIAGGVKWMFAAGDQNKATEAQKLLTNATIGLAIVLTAYAISFFVISTLITAVTTGS